MTLDQAVEHARRLDQEADADWPRGYSPAKVRGQTQALLKIFERESTSPAKAQAIIRRLDEVKEIW